MHRAWAKGFVTSEWAGCQMDNATYIALSRQTVLRRHMDIIANNIANAETASFKAERPLFAEFLDGSDEMGEMSYVQDYGTIRDLREGNMVKTGSPLDLALHGDGFFELETPRGLRYTRNGHFQLNGDLQLVNALGYALLNVDGRPVELVPGDLDITVAEDGTVSTERGPIGRIKIVAFDNPRALRREADSLLVADQAPIEPREVSIVQGMIEQSNVQTILEITAMIEVLRSYQSTQKLVDTTDDLQRRAVDRIARPV